MSALSQFQAVAAEVAATAPAEGKLWQLLAAALGEIKDEQIAAGLPVLNTAQACQLVNVGSRRALARWCKLWRVKASAYDRYPRRALEAGLQREADSGVRRRRTKEAS